MNEENNSSSEPAFLSHLIELRDRLLRSVLVIIVLLLPLLFYSRELFSFLSIPIIAVLPEGAKLIAIDVTAPFLAPFKLAIFVSIIIAVPYLLYQAWAFVAPGLYKNERRLIVPLLVSSTLLFYAGIAFAYLIVFKLIFGFFYNIAPETVSVTPDMSNYLNFTLKMFFAFGISFEVPILTILLCWTGMTTPDKLAAKRRYIIVGILILSMLMTPPDIISQLLLGLPMWLLFEAGIFFARRIVPKRDDDEDDEDDDTETEPVARQSTDDDSDIIATEDEWNEKQAAVAGADQTDDTEADEPYQEPDDGEIDAELDRIEAEEDADDDLEEDDKPADKS